MGKIIGLRNKHMMFLQWLFVMIKKMIFRGWLARINPLPEGVAKFSDIQGPNRFFF
jgi:hypothetical protein